MWPPTHEATPSTSYQYGEWARRQRPQGTVYGGSAPSYDPASAPVAGYRPAGVGSGLDSGSLEEVSGSLTGHILAQGRPDTPEERSSGSRAVVIIMVVVCILVVAGLAAMIAYLAKVF
jgi:hypothetical protein